MIGGETESCNIRATSPAQLDDKSSKSSLSDQPNEGNQKKLNLQDLGDKDHSEVPERGKSKFDRRMSQVEEQNSSDSSQKEPLSDVWIFDTFHRTWTQLNPSLRIQGSMAGKKIKKQFEPRLAHTAVIIDQFVIVFGGLNS